MGCFDGGFLLKRSLFGQKIVAASSDVFGRDIANSLVCQLKRDFELTNDPKKKESKHYCSDPFLKYFSVPFVQFIYCFTTLKVEIEFATKYTLIHNKSVYIRIRHYLNAKNFTRSTIKCTSNKVYNLGLVIIKIALQ